MQILIILAKKKIERDLKIKSLREDINNTASLENELLHFYIFFIQTVNLFKEFLALGKDQNIFLFVIFP